VTLFAAQGLVCGGTELEADSLLGVAVAPGKAEFEVGERGFCSFAITNRTSHPMALPSFRFLNLKQEDAEVAFYVKRRILKIDVWQGTNAVAMKPGWQNAPEESSQYPTSWLQPTQTVGSGFSLTRNWYPSFFALTNPGLYTVSLTLDTTTCKDVQIPKGVYVSRRAAFQIVPVAEFRARHPDELLGSYTQAKTTFYLKRIINHTGEYFPNVSQIVRCEGALAALIELTGSLDKEVATHSLALLGALHHALGRPSPPAVPGSVEEWQTWLEETGSKLTPQELWVNFDSHYP